MEFLKHHFSLQNIDKCQHLTFLFLKMTVFSHQEVLTYPAVMLWNCLWCNSYTRVNSWTLYPASPGRVIHRGRSGNGHHHSTVEVQQARQWPHPLLLQFAQGLRFLTELEGILYNLTHTLIIISNWGNLCNNHKLLICFILFFITICK